MLERRETSKSREFSLGETIFPFADEKWVAIKSSAIGKSLESNYNLLLPLNNLMPLEVNFVVRTCMTDGLHINPYHPESGYQIDGRDLNLKDRQGKLLASAKEDGIDPISPFVLDIYFPTKSLEKAGLVVIQSGEVQFLDDFAKIMHALHCLVSAGGTYVSRCSLLPETVDEDCFYINFFPIDTGPLAADSSVTMYENEYGTLSVGEGNLLFFSENDVEIKNIGVTFVMDPYS